jgi:hypothetical protein
MRIYIPTNPGWYGAAAAIFGPFLTILLIEPEWLGRMVGVSILFVIAPLALLWIAFRFAFTKKIDYPYDSSWIYKRYGKEVVDAILRVGAVALAVAFFIIMSPPFLKDVLFVIMGEVPLKRTGLVIQTNQGKGLITEYLTIDVYVGTHDNSFSASYFPPRYIMQGNTYEFLYLPNTHEILEARLVTGKAK